jgi:hypothetical protein
VAATRSRIRGCAAFVLSLIFSLGAPAQARAKQEAQLSPLSIVSETADSVTYIDINGQRRTVPREEYERLVTGALSGDAPGGYYEAFEPCPHPNDIYKDAPYHGKIDNAVKSKRPIDGQTALDNSVAFSEDSPNRVGVSSGEFVVLSQTLGAEPSIGRAAEFHGHVRSWSALTKSMQTALINAGLVSGRGKILE